MITQNEFSTDLKLASFPQFQISLTSLGAFYLFGVFPGVLIKHQFNPQSLNHELVGDSVLVRFGSSFQFRVCDFAEYNEFCDFVGVETVCEIFESEVEGC